MRSSAEPPVPGGAPGTGDWGPLDWCASGVGGTSYQQQEPRPEPGPAAPDGDGGEPPPSAPARRSPAGSGRRTRTGRSGRTAGSSSRAEEEPDTRDPATQARAICLRLLTGSPRTRRQLADALRRRGIPEEAAEEVLSRFEDVGLIDDAAFAGAWVESRHAGRGLARRALARELRSRGVSGDVADEAVARLDPEQEAQTARALVDRKLRSTRGLDRQVRIRRLAGMLARRGYPEGLALRVVREALAEEGESGEALDHWLPDD
ncbi:recombination regulator RecX [Streptomyces sp. NPDC001380]|uniref:recombination regulator RecX n=1 Tax=Streptomyces sp. NPDC001380 TaxID=3364566 RepID=UPI003698AC91